MFSGRIQNCFDSHVHWEATGSFPNRLSLKRVRKIQDLKDLIIQEQHYRGDWLLGYGWDQTQFTDELKDETGFPTKITLDALWPNTPVVFTRVDGHAYWVNSRALELSGLHSDTQMDSYRESGVHRDQNGQLTGVLRDRAMEWIEKNIPKASVQQVAKNLLIAQDTFHRAGFTHIRDLTCDETQWSAVQNISDSQKLFMAVEQFISADDPSTFHQVVDLALRAQKIKIPLVRVKGVKVYFDGALGSEGALLSKPYASGGYGLQLISESTVSEMMQICREKNLDLAIHTIGDEAAAKIVSLAEKLWTKKNESGPQLHIEHGELLRPETIRQMSKLKIHVHLQPCHWLSDKKWLKQKIGDLTNYAFRWQELESHQVPFTFGSDTPIEETSMQRNLDAVDDAASFQIPAIANPVQRHSYSDFEWPGQTYTEFENGKPTHIVFQGNQLR